MHKSDYDGWTVLRSGDFSGDVEFESPGGQHIKIPFNILVSLVADWTRDVKMAALEKATDREVLGLPR